MDYIKDPANSAVFPVQGLHQDILKPCKLFCIIVTGLLLLLASCSNNRDEGKIQGSIHKWVEEEQLYQSYIDKALSYNSDSFLASLDTILPKLSRGNQRIKGYQLFLRGYREFKKGNMDSAEALYTSMLPATTLDTPGNRDLLTLQQTGLARLEIGSSLGSQTFTRLYQVIWLNEHFPSRFRWWAHDVAANAWYIAGDLEKAAHFLNLALHALPDTSDYRLKAKMMSNRSRIESDGGNYRKALLYEDSVRALGIKAGDDKILAISTGAKAILYIKLGDTVRGYRLQQIAFEQKKKLGIDQLVEYMNIASTYYDHRDFATSLKYAKEATDLALKGNDEEMISKVYEIVAQAYLGLGKNDSAFLYLRNAYNAKLHLSDRLKAKEIAALEVNHDLAREQQHSRELALKNENKDTKLRQQRIVFLAFGISLLLALVLALVLLRQRRLREANEKMALEQRLLRSQTDPHFIYNTLSSLQGLVSEGESGKAINYISRFARLLRLSLQNSRHAFVSLHQEVEALDDYLSLQVMRFGDIFDYNVELYDGYESDDNLRIPPMMMQPFVENAIHHGIQDLDRRGRISVKIEKVNGMVRCMVEDNGHGTQGRNYTGRVGNSISTIITRERLQILGKAAGKKANLSISDKHSEGNSCGVLVVIDIPYLLGEEETIE